MSNLVSIEGKTRRGQINQQVIEMLREWLASADSGEVVGVMIVGTCADGSTNTSATDGDDFQRMLGAIEILKARLLRRHLED